MDIKKQRWALCTGPWTFKNEFWVFGLIEKRARPVGVVRLLGNHFYITYCEELRQLNMSHMSLYGICTEYLFNGHLIFDIKIGCMSWAHTPAHLPLVSCLDAKTI